MSEVEVDLSSDEGITYVELLYGAETDYTAQIIGMGGSTVNLGLYDPPHGHSTAITRLERADSLGDSVGVF